MCCATSKSMALSSARKLAAATGSTSSECPCLPVSAAQNNRASPRYVWPCIGMRRETKRTRPLAPTAVFTTATCLALYGGPRRYASVCRCVCAEYAPLTRRCWCGAGCERQPSWTRQCGWPPSFGSAPHTQDYVVRFGSHAGMFYVARSGLTLAGGCRRSASTHLDSESIFKPRPRRKNVCTRMCEYLFKSSW